MAKCASGNRIHPESINIKRIFHVLFKRKWLILAFTLGSLLAAIGISYLFSPIYATDARIFVRLGRETVNLPASVIRSEMLIADPVLTQLNNEVKLLASEKLLEKCVDSMGIEQFLAEPETLSEKIIHTAKRAFRWCLETLGFVYPMNVKEQVVVKLQKNLEIVPADESRMVNIHFFSKNSSLGEKFLQTLLPLYLDAHLQAYSYDNENKLFQQETKKALDEWRNAELELEAFKQKWNITAPELEQQELLSRISDLEMALKTAGNIKPENIDRPSINKLNLLARAAENPVLSSLAMKLIDLEIQRDAMIAQFTPGYKPYRDLVKKINKIQERLRVEISNSGTNAENMLLTYKKRLRVVSEKDDKIRKMKQVIDLKRKRYEFLLGKHEESLMIQAMNKAKIANVTVTEPPSTQPAPVSPKRLKNILLSLAFGLFGGMWIALLYEYVRKTVSFPEDLESRGINLLASFPFTDENADMSVSCEALYFALKPAWKTSGSISVLFTASHHGEGASTVSDAFSKYLAENVVSRVLLVDAELRGGGISKRYRLNDRPGFKDFIISEMKASDLVVQTELPGHFIMPSGQVMEKPGRVCHAENFIEKMNELKQQFDVVLYDVAPAAIYPDFAGFAENSDGIVIVTEAESTKIQVVDYTISRINKVSVSFLGAVINKRHQFIPQIIYKYI